MDKLSPKVKRPTTQLESQRFFTNRRSILDKSMKKLSFYSPPLSPQSHVSSNEKIDEIKQKL